MTKVHAGTLLIVLGVALFFLSSPSSGQEAVALEVVADGDAYTTGISLRPVGSPIEVLAHTEMSTVHPGGFGDVACAVENLTADTALGILIEGTVVYSDGRQQTILRRRQPEILLAGSTLIDFILFAVPIDATPGTAKFLCTASATRVTGGTNHGDYSNPIVDSDRSEFEVLESLTGP